MDGRAGCGQEADGSNPIARIGIDDDIPRRRIFHAQVSTACCPEELRSEVMERIPMRIAYVTNSTEGGGAALPIPAITQVLRDLGATVRVFALEKRDGHALPSLVAAGLDPLVRS